MGVEYALMHAGYDEVFEFPRGFGFHVDIPVIPRIAFRLGYRSRAETHVQDRIACVGLLLPGVTCPVDTFDGRTTLRSYTLGVALDLGRAGARLRPELSAYGSSSKLTSRFIGRNTDSVLEPATPGDRTEGFGVDLALEYELSPRLSMAGRFGIEKSDITTTGSDMWFPFWDSRLFYSAGLGLRFRVGRPSSG